MRQKRISFQIGIHLMTKIQSILCLISKKQFYVCSGDTNVHLFRQRIVNSLSTKNNLTEFQSQILQRLLLQQNAWKSWPDLWVILPFYDCWGDPGCTLSKNTKFTASQRVKRKDWFTGLKSQIKKSNEGFTSRECCVYDILERQQFK